MKASLVDTHTHIYYHTDPVELDKQIARCLEKNIDQLILPNVDIASIPLVFHATEKYADTCYAMLGLHPCSVKEDYRQVLKRIESEIEIHEIVAIGEIGLDLHWDTTLLTQQEEALKIQLNWAKDMSLPVSIHCRKAFNELLPILQNEQDGRLTGVLHCFAGTDEEAKQVLDLGLILGIGGVVTFKNAGLDQVVKKRSLSQIVLETDAPYLAPVPYRGKENESSYLDLVAQKVADLLEISVDAVAETTTKTAQTLFKLPQSGNSIR